MGIPEVNSQTGGFRGFRGPSLGIVPRLPVLGSLECPVRVPKGWNLPEIDLLTLEKGVWSKSHILDLGSFYLGS